MIVLFKEKQGQGEGQGQGHLRIAAIKLLGSGDVTARKHAEVLITAVSAVRAVVTHQRVRNVLHAVRTRHHGRVWRQGGAARIGRTVDFTPAGVFDVTG